ncbi:MAG: hypothetical protein ABSC89_04570 [Verrucomicrobiota bacterium]
MTKVKVQFGDVGISMEYFNFRAVVPVLQPYPMEGRDKLCKETERQVLGLSGGIPLFDHKNVFLNVSAVPAEEVKDLKRRYFQFSHIRPFHLYSFEAKIPYEPEKIEAEGKSLTKRDKKSLFLSMVCENLEAGINNLVITTNLARPESYDLDRTSVFINGEFFQTFNALRTGDAFYLVQAHPFKWPKLKLLPVRVVLEWLNSVEDFQLGFSSTPLGRSLICFSYLFSTEVSKGYPVFALWSLIGLEALYGSNGSRRELTEKIQLFLGAHPSVEKDITNIYKIRSGIAHGGKDLPRSYNEPDALPQFDKYMDDTGKLASLAGQLLIASFQKMILEGLKQIKFEFKLVKQPA